MSIPSSPFNHGTVSGDAHKKILNRSEQIEGGGRTITSY